MAARPAWSTVLITIALAALVPSSVAGADISVTACGTVVPAGKTGVLSGDLTCTNAAPAVVIQKGAALDLAGFTLMVSGPGSGDDAIVCERGRCTVESSATGGRIVTSGLDSVIEHTVSGHGRVVLRDVAIEISPPGSTEFGVRAAGFMRIDVRSSSISGAASHGIVGPRAKLIDVTLTDNWVGIGLSQRLKGIGLTVTGGGTGVAGGAVKLIGCEAHGAQYNGIQGERVRLIDCNVTGNNLGGLAGDVGSYTLPRLDNTVCGTSQVLEQPPGTNWGVCSGD